VEIFYPELRRIAAARMRAERLDHTLQPTALVHQLYLELVKVKALRSTSSGGTDEKSAFLGLAAYLMKRLLIHHARPLSKRAERTALPDFPTPASGTEQALLEIDDTLNRLAAINLRPGWNSSLRGPDARESLAKWLGTTTVAAIDSPATGWRLSGRRMMMTKALAVGSRSMIRCLAEPGDERYPPLGSEIADRVLAMLDEIRGSSAVAFERRRPVPVPNATASSRTALRGRFVLPGLLVKGMGESIRSRPIQREVALNDHEPHAYSQKLIREAQAASVLNHRMLLYSGLSAPPWRLS
jgi:hypothetical protein